MAQRLVRRVCAACGDIDRPAERVLRRLGLCADDLRGATPRAGRGCQACGGTGEVGRTAVSEILSVDTELRELIAERASEAQLARAARSAGMTSLREKALTLAAAGEPAPGCG